MIKRFFLFSLLMISSLALQAQFDAAKQALEKKMLQDRYVSFIEARGYEPSIDSDGDVKFTYNERTYYITLDMKDTDFFRIAKLSGLKLTEAEKIARAVKICHDVTRDSKVAKVYWLKGTLWTSTELLMDDPDNFKGVFDRAMRLTEIAYEKFLEAWKESGQ